MAICPNWLGPHLTGIVPVVGHVESARKAVASSTIMIHARAALSHLAGVQPPGHAPTARPFGMEPPACGDSSVPAECEMMRCIGRPLNATLPLLRFTEDELGRRTCDFVARMRSEKHGEKDDRLIRFIP